MPRSVSATMTSSECAGHGRSPRAPAAVESLSKGLALRADKPGRSRGRSESAPMHDACRQFAAELVLAADDIARRILEQLRVDLSRTQADNSSLTEDILEIRREVHEIAGRIMSRGEVVRNATPDDEPAVGHSIHRWTAQRKVALVIEVRTGKLTIEEAHAQYGVTADEIASWAHAFDVNGLEGLKVTKAAQKRKANATGERGDAGAAEL